MLEKWLEWALAAIVTGGGALFRGGSGRGEAGRLPGSEAAPDDAPVVIGEALGGGLRGGKGRPSASRPATTGAGPGSQISLALAERRRHLYILGKTGSGKTVLQTTLFLADVEAHRAVALIDFRGDLLDRAMLFLADRYSPDELKDRLILLDLREKTLHATPGEPLVCFNPLTECGADAYTSAFFMLDLLRQQWGDLGIQMQETLRNALLALALTGGTLAEIEPLLTVPGYRRKILARVGDATVRRFFDRFEALGAAGQLAWTLPVLNKLSVYFARPRLRAVLGQRADEGGTGPLSIRQALAEERPDRILLVCLAADELFQTAGILGNAIAGAIARSFMRADRDPASRRSRTLHLLLDEFENLATASGELFEEVLSEARRYGLYATLAHQATDQLPPRLRSLLRNLAATHVYFGLGGSDSDTVAGELPSEESRVALRCLLTNQPVGHALILRQGQPLVRMRTHYTPEPGGNGGDMAARVAAVRRASLERWGIPRTVAEQRLADRERDFETSNRSQTPEPTTDRDPTDPVTTGAKAVPASSGKGARAKTIPVPGNSTGDSDVVEAAPSETAPPIPEAFEVRDAPDYVPVPKSPRRGIKKKTE